MATKSEGTLTVAASSTVGQFLDLVCSAARESMLDPASPRRHKRTSKSSGDTEPLDAILQRGSESSDACKFGEWAALSVSPSTSGSSIRVQLPYDVAPLRTSSIAPPKVSLLHGWEWNTIGISNQPSLSAPMHARLFVDCSCLPYTAGGGGIAGHASERDASETSKQFLHTVSRMFASAPASWRISIASSVAAHYGGSGKVRGDHGDGLRLYDVVATFSDAEQSIARLTEVVEGCVTRIVATSEPTRAGHAINSSHGSGGLPFIVVEVEDMESGKRSYTAWFMLDALRFVEGSSSSAASAPDVRSIGRGLAHFATLLSSASPSVILNVPNLDLESSNLDATAHDVVQALMALQLLSSPAVVDAFVTFPTLVSSSMMLLHQVPPGECAVILDRCLSSWVSESHDEMLRRSLDLEMEDDDSALFSVQNCEAFHEALVSVVRAVISWARSARSTQSSRSETPERAAPPSRSNEESPPDAHNATVFPVDGPAAPSSDAHFMDDMSPILKDDTSHVASPLLLSAHGCSGRKPVSPMPPPHLRHHDEIASRHGDDDDDLHILSAHRRAVQLSPSPAASAAGKHNRILSGDLVASGGAFSFSDSIDVLVLKQIQQQEALRSAKDIADSSSPNPQRGPSLFNMEDSLTINETSPKRNLPLTQPAAVSSSAAQLEQISVLKATIAALEHEKRQDATNAQDTIAQLKAQVISEQQQAKRWQAEARNLLAIAQGSLLQVPMTMTSSGSVKDNISDASASLTTIPGTPSSPLPLNNSVASPGELRAARKQRQLQQHALSSSGLARFLSSSGQFSELGASGFGARTPTNAVPVDDRGSNASSARHRSFASTSFNAFNSPISMDATSHASFSAIVRLMQAQAFRRALLEAREAKDCQLLMSGWSQDAVHKSHVFVKRTLRKFHDSVDLAVKAQHRIAMEALEARSRECLDALESLASSTTDAGNTLSATKSSRQVSPQASSLAVPGDDATPPLPQPKSHQFITLDDSIAIANLSMTDASSLTVTGLHGQEPMSPNSSMFASATPLRQPITRGGSVRSSFTNRATPKLHRIISSTPGTSIVSTRPEAAQAFIMAGRNLRGEERKSAGERAPNLKFDQIRKEAVTWKQSNLDEYKLFASHQVILLGDGHVGKSSVVACLTNKAPVLFKKPPQVITPTLDIRRTRATVLLDRGHGSAAVVPVGGFSRLTMAEAARICKEQMLLKEPATLPASATTCSLPICLTEVPCAVLRAPCCSLLTPARAAIYCIVFRLSDDEEVSRQAILRYVQHVIGSMLRTAVTPSSEGTTPHLAATLPFVLIGTHADQASGNGSSSTGTQDLTGFQNVLSSFRRWLEEEFHAITTASLCPLVLDTFAVSCSNWTVYGERPRSADTFAAMLADWAGYLTLSAPSAPAHLLPSARHVAEIVDSEGPFSDEEDEGTADASDTSPPKAEVAPVMVDYTWARRGGGSQSGGLFSTTTTAAAKSTSLWTSGVGAATGSTPREQAAMCAERWLHSAAVGLITLFTALHRFTEFTGYVLDASMFDNIVFQHLELAPRMDDERRLSRRLLRVRDVIVEEILAECDRRGFIARLKVPAGDRRTEVVVLGTPWLDQIVSSLMLPYTLQVASTLPTNSPSVRKSVAGVGARHIVALLQRTSALGIDLVSSAMPVELASYRMGHVSRKLLFQLLPLPIRAVASTQRNTAAFFTAIGVMPSTNSDDDGDQTLFLSKREDSQDTIITQSGSPTNLSQGFGGLLDKMHGGGCSSSSLFIPCVSYVMPQVAVQFLDDVAHLVAEVDVHVATIQVEMPSMDLFYAAQSRLYQQAANHWATTDDNVTPHPVGNFCGFSSRNCFMVTVNDNAWVLLTAVGGTESDCTYSEYRVVLARHTVSALPSMDADKSTTSSGTGDLDQAVDDEAATEEPDDPQHIIQRVADAFGSGSSSRLVSVEGPEAERRKVEPWARTEQRVQSTLGELGMQDASSSTNNKSREGLRGMMERTERPNLKIVLQLLCVQSA